LFLVGAFIALLVLLQIGVLRFAFKRLGISSGAALVVLFGSLLGSYFNIPVAYLPEQHVFARQEIDFFGMRYIGGSLGTLIGADLLNLGSIPALERLSLQSAEPEPWMEFFLLASSRCLLRACPNGGAGADLNSAVHRI
jgi:uncharacterized membrane protein